MAAPTTATPLHGDEDLRLSSKVADDFEVPFTVGTSSTPTTPWPRFGDLKWEITGLDVRPRSRRFLDFTAISPEWSLIARELIYLRTKGQDAMREKLRGTLRRSQAPLRASSLSTVLAACRILERACDELDIGLPVDWMPSDTDALSDWVKRNHPHASVGSVVGQLHRYRDELTLGGIHHDPLRNMSIYAWSGARRPEQVVGDGLTPDVFAALMRNALAYLERFSPDILAAFRWKSEIQQRWDNGEYEKLPKRLPAGHPAREHGIGGPLIWSLHQFINKHGALPSYTQDSGTSSGRKGELALMSLAALLDNPTLKGNGSAKKYLRDRVDGGVPLRPGMLPLNVSEVELPDGSTGPWRDPFCWIAIDQEVTLLRDACAIVLVALTGMRASEAVCVPREGWRTEWFGHPALMSRLIKNNNGEPRKWWATDPVIRACEILEETCPEGAETLLASSINSKAWTQMLEHVQQQGVAEGSHLRVVGDDEEPEAEDEDDVPAGFAKEADVTASTSLRRFIVHINTADTLRYRHRIAARAEWGKRSTDEGDDSVSPHRLRHTLASIGNSAALGDVALFTQFQHATHAVTWSYMQNNQRHKWTELLVNRKAVEGLETVIEMGAGVWSGEESISGPAGKDIQQAFEERFSDPALPAYDPDDVRTPTEQFAALVVDNGEVAAMIRAVASEVHLGVMNHCRWRPDRALCASEDATEPVLAACVPESCGNMVAQEVQATVFRDLLAETEEHLGLKRIPEAQRTLFEQRRDRLKRLLAELPIVTEDADG